MLQKYSIKSYTIMIVLAAVLILPITAIAAEPDLDRGGNG